MWESITWKLFAGDVLDDATSLTIMSERGGRQVARIQIACVLDLNIVKHKQGSKLRRIQPTSKFTRGQIHPLTQCLWQKYCHKRYRETKNFFIRLRQYNTYYVLSEVCLHDNLQYSQTLIILAFSDIQN